MYDNPAPENQEDERLMRLMPHQRHAFLYYLIVGIIDGDVKWCHLLQVHKATPRPTATTPPRDDVQTVLLHLLDGVLQARFKRRKHFRAVRVTLFALLYERPPNKLKERVQRVMMRFAAQEYPALNAHLPVPISPE